jgi:hypothetical protein
MMIAAAGFQFESNTSYDAFQFMGSEASGMHARTGWS